MYRWLLLAFTLFLIHSFFESHGLSSLGYLVVAMGLGGLLASHACDLASALRLRGRLPELQRVRFYLACGVGLSLGLAFFLLPLPFKVRGTALIQVDPEHAQRVVVTEPGFLQELYVVDGQRVKAGEILALLASPKLEIQLRVNEVDQTLRHQQHGNLVALLTDLDLQDQRDGDSWTQNGFELKTLVQSQRSLSKQRERLELRAPCAGIVQGLESKEIKGKWLEKGTEFCMVGNERARCRRRSPGAGRPKAHPDRQPGKIARALGREPAAYGRREQHRPNRSENHSRAAFQSRRRHCGHRARSGYQGRKTSFAAVPGGHRIPGERSAPPSRRASQREN